MDNPTIYIMIFGMALVTFLPRILPLVFFRNINLSPFFLRFLRYIPYTILGALIFPGIFFSTGTVIPAIVGCITAILLAWLGLNLLFIVLGSVFITVLIQII